MNRGVFTFGLHKHNKFSYFQVSIYMRPYRKILIASFLLTCVLFGLDYMNDSSPHITTRQILFDIVVWGSLYVIAIFIVASLLYYCCNKLAILFSKVFSRKNG